MKKSQALFASPSSFAESEVWSSVYKHSQQSTRVTDFPSEADGVMSITRLPRPEGQKERDSVKLLTVELTELKKIDTLGLS